MIWINLLLIVSLAAIFFIALRMDRSEKRDQKLDTVVKAMPRQGKWLEADKNAWREFLKTTTGKKLVEHCQHRLFVDHVDACVNDKDAVIHNASMKGANNLLSAQLYLATEDSIQGGELPVNGSQTNAQPDPLESARDSQRV